MSVLPQYFGLQGQAFPDPVTGNFTDPGVGNVVLGVTYFFNGSQQTGTYSAGGGTYTDPGVANVRSGISYTFNSVVQNGTLVVPSLSNTKIGVAGDGGTGTYDGSDRWTDPGVATVQSGVVYKANSTTNNRTGTYDPVTGNYTDPGVAHVQSGVSYTFAGSVVTGTYDPITGNYTNPGIGNVTSGVTYKFGGANLTGTYDPVTGNYTDPGIANVTFGVTYKFAGSTLTGTSSSGGTYTDPGIDNVRLNTSYTFNSTIQVGTLVIPAASFVKTGYEYGAGGIEFTGSLNCCGDYAKVSFATPADLILQYDARRVAELASDTGTPVSAGALASNTVVLYVLARATETILMNARLGKRYSEQELIYLATDPNNCGIGSELRGLCTDLAFGYLVMRRGTGETDRNRLSPAFMAAQNTLALLSRGEFVFAHTCAEAQIAAGTPEAAIVSKSSAPANIANSWSGQVNLGMLPSSPFTRDNGVL